MAALKSRGEPAERTLSKSDFKLARTCATKLYYRELGYPDTSRDDPYLAMLAEGGYMVEVLAKQRFPEGITLDYSGDSRAAAADTARALAQDAVTLFEATLLEGGRLVRVDILKKGPTGFDLYEVKAASFDPADADKRIAKSGSPFRSLTKPFGISSEWSEYLEDVTYQVTVLKDLYPGIPVRPHLILMNKGAAAEVDDMPSWFRIVRHDDGQQHRAEFVGDPEVARRSALTIGVDVSAEVAELEGEVRDASESFLASLTPTLTRIATPLGGKCAKCEFRVDESEEKEEKKKKNGFLECWGDRGRVRPHVLELYQGRDLREGLIAAGVDAIAEITDQHFTGRTGKYAERQRIQVAHARSGEEWVEPELGEALRAARWPIHFIDFEAAGLAIPHHRGMKPYGRIAWQWSCHTLAAPDATLEHREFINQDVRWPNERFAQTLREALGESGSVMVWSGFEGGILREVADELTALGSGDKELAEWLRATALAAPKGEPSGRIIDLLKLCREHYYHPGMGGSNSIKAVLDALWRGVPEVRERYAALTGAEGDPEAGPYQALPPIVINGEPQYVAEGTGAVRAYFAMVYGAERADPTVGEAWRRLLLDYCRLDTLAMVLIWEHWVRISRNEGG